MALPKIDKLESSNKQSKSKIEIEAINKLRSTQKWKNYFHNLRPRNNNNEVLPFPKVSSSKGMSEEDFSKYIDKLVLSEVNYSQPKKSFDDFYKKFKER